MKRSLITGVTARNGGYVAEAVLAKGQDGVRETKEDAAKAASVHANLPNGTPRKLFVVSRLAEVGGRTPFPVEGGIEVAYRERLKAKAEPV